MSTGSTKVNWVYWGNWGELGQLQQAEARCYTVTYSVERQHVVSVGQKHIRDEVNTVLNDNMSLVSDENTFVKAYMRQLPTRAMRAQSIIAQN